MHVHARQIYAQEFGSGDAAGEQEQALCIVHWSSKHTGPMDCIVSMIQTGYNLGQDVQQIHC